MLRPKILETNRFEFANASLKKHANNAKEVFDVGAGSGELKKSVERAGFKYRGFDLKPNKKNIQKWDLSESCPQGKGCCNTALLLEVLEHLVNPANALKNIREALQKNGILVITCPNPRWSKSRIHALLTGYPSCFTRDDLKLNHHVFVPWPHIVEKILKESGFEVIEYCLIEGPTKILPKAVLSLSMPYKLVGNIICRLVEKVDPTACGMSFGMVAKAK